MSIQGRVVGYAKCASLLFCLAFGSGCSGEDFEPTPQAPGLTGGSAGMSGAGGAGADGGQSGGGSASAGGTAGDGGSGPVGVEPLGTECAADGDCASGYCADGVCCNSACSGTCESCNQTDKLGSCEPHAAGSDPEDECSGKGLPGDVCAGSCDGSSGCSFPASETSCGDSTCSAGVQTGKSCGGDGSCIDGSTDCAPFVCGGSSCKSSCTIDADCAVGAWCNAGLCEAKQANGASCSASIECLSSLCEQGSCCSSACAAPSACSTGQCLCGGKTCKPGASCITWYLDNDGDGFGATGPNDSPGCSDTPPPPVAGKSFVKTSTDCYDGNAQAFPGQTKYFTTHRGDGSFDYDCNAGVSYEHAVVTTLVCKNCGYKGPLGCISCPSSMPTMGLECMPGLKGSTCTGVKTKAAFYKFTACGQSGSYQSCDSCGGYPSASTKTQGCR